MSNLLRSLVFGVLVSLANTSMPHLWYETLPAVALDYKVHIDAGKEDCYFQYVNTGATFYVNFQVYSYFQDTVTLLKTRLFICSPSNKKFPKHLSIFTLQ